MRLSVSTFFVHGRLDVAAELVHRKAELVPNMLHITVIAGDATLVALAMGNNNTVPQRVQAELFAKVCKQLNRRFVGTHDRCFGVGAVAGLYPACAAGVFDGAGLAHFHADVGVIAGAFRPGCAMPAAPVPRQTLVHIAGVTVDKAVDARTIMAGTVPILYEYLCGRLRASDAM